MSEFLEDPSVLTKDKLKSELLANDVPLPSGEQRKDVYVQLYLKHLTVLNKKHSPADTFSSDEEITPMISNRSQSGKKATKKTDKNRKEEVDVAGLTDSDLKDLLLKYDINPGPIVASTRKLYEKRIKKLLDQSPSETTPPEPETAVPETVPVKADGSQNGDPRTGEDQYSDKEEDVQPVPEPVPVTARLVRSRGKTPVITRTSSRHSSKQVEGTTAAEEQSLSVDRSDLLKEIFPNEPPTPTGISATCRRPIHGAAGRPVRPHDLWPEESLLQQHVFATKSSLSQSHSTPLHAPSFSESELRPRRRSYSIWLKLVVFLLLAASLYFIFQNVSSEQIDSCIIYLQDKVVTPLLTVIGVIGQKQNSGNK